MKKLTSVCTDPFWYLDNAEIPFTYYDAEIKCLDEKAALISRRLMRKIRSGCPIYELIDESVELIARELRPSYFGYLCSLVASEFPYTFLHWCQGGVLAAQIRILMSTNRAFLTKSGHGLQRKEQRQIFPALRASTRRYLESSQQLLSPQSYESLKRNPDNKPAAAGERKGTQSKALQIPSLPHPGSRGTSRPGRTCIPTNPSKKPAPVLSPERKLYLTVAESLIKYSILAVIAFLASEVTTQFHSVDPAAGFCVFAAGCFLIVKLVGAWQT